MPGPVYVPWRSRALIRMVRDEGSPETRGHDRRRTSGARGRTGPKLGVEVGPAAEDFIFWGVVENRAQFSELVREGANRGVLNCERGDREDAAGAARSRGPWPGERLKGVEGDRIAVMQASAGIVMVSLFWLVEGRALDGWIDGYLVDFLRSAEFLEVRLSVQNVPLLLTR